MKVVKKKVPTPAALDAEFLLTELAKASVRCNVLRVKQLLRVGARRLVSGRRFPACIFTRAARLNSSSILKLLLNAGANVDMLSCVSCSEPTRTRVTALHVAVAYGTLQSIRVLVQAGANVNASSSDGLGPLWYISMRRFDWSYANKARARLLQKELAQIFRLFIAAGVDVNARTTKPSPNFWHGGGIAYISEVGTTMLHAAVARADEHLVRALLDAGADVNVTSSETNKTALHYTRDAYPAVKAMITEQLTWLSSTRRRWLLTLKQQTNKL